MLGFEGEDGEEGGYPYGEYEGGRDENLDRHGWGSALLPNKDIYEGNYFHGMRQGQGLYVFRNGARYNGEWRKGKKSGLGEFIYPDGTRYFGDWKKDLKHGFGAYYYINGDTYEGAWYKGKRDGLGTYTWAKDGTKFIGTWKAGRMIGPAKVMHPRHVYHGPFNLNLQKGFGCFTFDLKIMQHGYYINIKDPAFDYLGGSEEEELRYEEECYGEEEDGMVPLPKGLIPVWRVKSITEYKPELLPPEPVPVPVDESVESLIEVPEVEPQLVTPPGFDVDSGGEEGAHHIYDDPFGTARGLLPETFFCPDDAAATIK
ncbi:radial spoke head 1 homolog [Chrysoperla carnea]|uniref:radial spoke head 1 homolog n=1 Tax=Chrysoperla carnea TaxID=189513 RepID=UPI001D099E97|nr:radial spoke head 1 homolog [Chrysoperla carnea]